MAPASHAASTLLELLDLVEQDLYRPMQERVRFVTYACMMRRKPAHPQRSEYQVMDVSAVTSAPPLVIARIHPDESRRRAAIGAAMADNSQTAFQIPADEAFGSAAPVAVGAMTEVAVADLQPVDGLPLAEAIHRYADQD